MTVFPGLTATRSTTERMKAFVSEISLSRRNAAMSLTLAVTVSSLLDSSRRSAAALRATLAATSRFACHSWWCWRRGRISSTSRSVVSASFHSRSTRCCTARSSASMCSSFARSSAATPSISPSTMRTSSRMVVSVRMWSRICSMMSLSKRLALSQGVAQVPRPCFNSEWQT